jgi:hypothetical protein
VTYLQLAGDTFKSVVAEEITEVITWQTCGPHGSPETRQARLPRVIFVR